MNNNPIRFIIVATMGFVAVKLVGQTVVFVCLGIAALYHIAAWIRRTEWRELIDFVRDVDIHAFGKQCYAVVLGFLLFLPFVVAILAPPFVISIYFPNSLIGGLAWLMPFVIMALLVWKREAIAAYINARTSRKNDVTSG